MTSLLSPSPSAPKSDTAKASLDKSKPVEAPPVAPPPTFDVLPLSQDLRATLAEMGYVHPTPVQIAVFEPATRGKDLVVQARTGTGKTAAFGLPIVDHIVKRSVDRVQVLTLCPTRELALQVGREVERLGKRRGVRVTAIYGGAPMQKQIDAIAAGAQVVCGTPGRVLDHLRRGTLDASGIRLVVLDESDEMLSMGFERELNAILEFCPPERQTLLFSATLPPDIERIAKNKLKSPEFVTLSGDHVGALSIQHYVYMVNSDKTNAFLRMVEVDNPESAIVFCNTKDETERLASALQRQGFDADWLNGDLDQGERERVMAATREGRVRFLVATDVAARGIDISHLTHVINFDFPQDAESYVHRTGRTGRAGRTGMAISLVTPQDIGQLYLLRLTYKIRPIEKQTPSESELKTRAETDVVAMFAEAYNKASVHPEDLSLARRLLTHDNAETILAGLLRDHLGARPTARDEASASRRVARPRPSDPVRETPVVKPAVPVAAAAPVVSAPARAAAPAPVPAPRAPVAAPVLPPVISTQPLPPTSSVTPAIAPAITTTQPLAVTPVSAAPAPASVPAAVAPAEVVRPLDTLEMPLVARPQARPAPMAPASDARPPMQNQGDARSPMQNQGDARPQGGGYGGGPGSGGFGGPRRDERPGRDGRRGGRDRDGRRAPDLAVTDRRDREITRVGDLSDGARDRAAAPRPLDQARPTTPTAEGGAAPQKAFARHADFTTWQPPEEEGDDEPIWGDSRRPGAAPPVRSESRSPVHSPSPSSSLNDEPRSASPSSEDGGEAPLPMGEVVELHVTVGRRDGARASDIVRALEKAGLSKDSVQRVRVRERHAFLSVRKDDEERAIGALNGVTIAGRTATAERARERPASTDAAAESNGNDDPVS